MPSVSASIVERTVTLTAGAPLSAPCAGTDAISIPANVNAASACPHLLPVVMAHLVSSLEQLGDRQPTLAADGIQQVRPPSLPEDRRVPELTHAPRRLVWPGRFERPSTCTSGDAT
jgi:hypothetical protein